MGIRENKALKAVFILMSYCNGMEDQREMRADTRLSGCISLTIIHL